MNQKTLFHPGESTTNTIIEHIYVDQKRTRKNENCYEMYVHFTAYGVALNN